MVKTKPGKQRSANRKTMRRQKTREHNQRSTGEAKEKDRRTSAARAKQRSASERTTIEYAGKAAAGSHG